MTGVATTPSRKRDGNGDEGLFRDLFEKNPYPLFVEGWSRLKAYFKSLRAAGIRDMAAHFAAHPEVARRIPDLIEMIERARRRTS